MKILTPIIISLLLVVNITLMYPLKAKAVTNVVDAPGFLDEAYAGLMTGVIAGSGLAINVFTDLNENLDEIQDHARKQFSTLTQTAKDGFRSAMILQESGLLVPLAENVWDELIGGITSFLTAKALQAGISLGLITKGPVYINLGTPINVQYFENGVLKSTYPDRYSFGLSVVSVTSSTYRLRMRIGKAPDFVGGGNEFLSPTRPFSSNEANALSEEISRMKSHVELLALFKSWGIINGGDLVLGGVSDTIYDPTLKRALDTDIPAMKDAGLVLPMPEAYHPTTKERIYRDANTGTMTLPDGSIYTGDVTWKSPGIAVSTDLLGNPALGWTNTNATTGDLTWTNIRTGESVTTKKPPKDPVKPEEPKPTSPFKDLIPVAMLLVLLDLLVAILMYLVRMFEFILKIPLVNEIPIPNPAFHWFKNVTWLGIKPYSLTMSLATFFVGFMAFKSIRRFLP